MEYSKYSKNHFYDSGGKGCGCRSFDSQGRKTEEAIDQKGIENYVQHYRQ